MTDAYTQMKAALYRDLAAEFEEDSKPNYFTHAEILTYRAMLLEGFTLAEQDDHGLTPDQLARVWAWVVDNRRLVAVRFLWKRSLWGICGSLAEAKELTAKIQDEAKLFIRREVGIQRQIRETDGGGL